MENVEKNNLENNEEMITPETESQIENSGEQKKEEEHKDHKKKHKHPQYFEELDHEELLKECDKLIKENDKSKKSLEEKEKETMDYLDRYRRTLAEMENMRKRTTVEKQDFLKYSNFNIISDLLVILDDFQRAIDTGKTGTVDINNYVLGIEMIEKQFIDLLFKKYGVVKYGEKGEEFDPNIHQAMMMEQGNYDKETIIDIFRNGYMLHDRVIRPAQVKVGKPN